MFELQVKKNLPHYRRWEHVACCSGAYLRAVSGKWWVWRRWWWARMGDCVDSRNSSTGASLQLSGDNYRAKTIRYSTSPKQWPIHQQLLPKLLELTHTYMFQNFKYKNVFG